MRATGWEGPAHRRLRPIRRLLVGHAVGVAILAVAFLGAGATAVGAALVLPLTCLGAPWSLLPWVVEFESFHGYQLAMVAAAMLNVVLHAVAARRGVDVLRRPAVLVAVVAVAAFAVSPLLAAYATVLGGGPTATLLVLVGSLVVPVGVTIVGVGRQRAAA